MGLLKYLGLDEPPEIRDIPEIKGIRVDLVSELPFKDFEQVVVTDNLVSLLNKKGGRRTYLFDFMLIPRFRRAIKKIRPDFVLDLPSQPELLGQFFEDRSKLPTDRILLKYRDYVVYPPGTRDSLKKPYQLMLFE